MRDLREDFDSAVRVILYEQTRRTLKRAPTMPDLTDDDLQKVLNALMGAQRKVDDEIRGIPT